MNGEVKKIKENNTNLSAAFLGNRFEKDEAKKELCTKLNTNMGDFYSLDSKSFLEDYAEKIIENIYLILEAFAHVNIYPGRFFEIIKSERLSFITHEGDNDYKRTILLNTYNQIKRELGITKSLNKENISDDIGTTYDEMVKFYLDYRIANVDVNKEKIRDRNYVEKATYKSSFLTEKFLLADFIDEEIECLMNLMFDYLTLLVEMGINPKERLNEIIEEKKEKHQSK